MDHEQSKLRLETRDHNEIILMRLRRLSRTVMCKSERHRFEARTLQRSNIIKYLEDNLLHPSEQIRFVALELLCCTIPRLANKTDCLLKPLLPKVFQCLKKNESKELKTRALHFLRGYFQHTRRLSGFIDNFVKIGIQSSDPEIQISCCLGLNIIFDQDLGNGLYSQLVMPVANILMQKSNFELARSAYRALKCIHKTVSDARFFDLINMAQPVAAELYRNIYNFDETDSFLTMEDNDCSTVILEYQVKRYYLNLSKDFGILDPDLLYQIQKTRSCERARATSSFFLALKQTPWTADDLDPHILDFVKFINSLVSDSNRLVQMYGFDILKEVINRMGFTLAPHIYWVVNILRQGLVSENSKIKLKVYRVLYKLMRCIHPMTVVWNLLKTDETSIKEAVIMLIQNMLSHFSYHEIDMIALCNYLGQNLEDTNSKLASCSRDCIILLLDIIRDCPAYGIKTEAVKTLLKNHSLSTQTLKDIGIIGNITEDVCREGFESYSDEEITDRDSSSLPDSGTVITTALSHRTLSTAGESDAKYGPANSGIVNLVKSFRTLCKNASCSHFQTGCKLVSVQPSDISVSMSYRSISTAGESHAKCDDAYSNLDLIKSSKTFYDHLMGTNMYEEHKSINNESPKRKNAAENLDLDSSRNEETTVTWDENYIDSLKKIEENASAESSVSSSIKEQLLSLDSTPSRSAHIVSCEKHKSNASTPPWADFINIDDNLECCHKYEAEECNLHQILAPEKLNTGCRKRRYFTRFFMKSAVDDFASNSEKKAEGDVYIILENNSTATQKFDKEMNTAELTSDAQNCIQVDVMNNNDYNFNIMTIDHPETDKDSNYTDDFDSIDDTDGTGDNNKLKKIQTDTDEECPRHKPKNVQKSFIPRLDPNTKDCELLENISQAQSKYPATLSQKLGESNICKEKGNDVEVMNDAEIDKQLFQETLLTENSFLSKETHDELTNPVDEEAANMQMSHLIAERNDVCVGSTDKNEFLCEVSFQKEEGIPTEASPFNSKDLDETPFMPKNRQLPRTPVQTKAETSIDAQPKLPKISRKKPTSIKRKGTIKERFRVCI